MDERIKKLSCTPRQKKILQILHEFSEGWLSEEALEDKLEQLFKEPKKQ